MGTVNVSGLEPGFFITVAIFILFILSMLGMGVLSLFQQKVRPGIAYFAAGVAGIIVFAVVINVMYV
ncbi:hypothetical protein FE783_06765 [Paenibacillus mesophilus]|uniref:hypothetical protein n=1 Tax=Paenibacillus mesophilus TaxID=2582849 RepID=UPI00110E2B29|nr:hypothetical protein [Paenibacillus mesophilus]TMV51474.1 hypothetical protein FE783_06765 [Paenibacillus mesophilus]